MANNVECEFLRKGLDQLPIGTILHAWLSRLSLELFQLCVYFFGLLFLSFRTIIPCCIVKIHLPFFFFFAFILPFFGGFIYLYIYILFIYLFLLEANYFTILYWLCPTTTWICHGCTCVPNPEPPSHLPAHTIPLGHLSAPAPSCTLAFWEANGNFLFFSLPQV